MSTPEMIEVKPIRDGFGVVEKDRKLARIVEIDDVVVHPNADKLELAVIGGWQLCVKKGEYTKGQRAIYCEIDSLLPLSNIELFGFLEDRRSDNRRVNGENYHRLKTIKLRKELSQGLLVPVPEQFKDTPVDTNLTLELGILKYEPKPVKERDGNGGEIAKSDILGRVIRFLLKGLDGSLNPWPSLLTKSDQDRVQNKSVAFSIAKKEETSFEVTYKLDGSSMTVFCIPSEGSIPRTGVCSRNFELSMGDEAPWSIYDQVRYYAGSFLTRNRKFIQRARRLQPDGEFKSVLVWKGFHFPEWRKGALATENNFTRYVKEHNVIRKLVDYYQATGEYITVQGELVGPDIQSNFEGVDKHEFYVFSVYRNGNEEVLPDEAREIVAALGLNYVPVLNDKFVIGQEMSVKDIVEMAEGPRGLNPTKQTFREGLVFKARHKVLSFKSISNRYLLKKEKEEEEQAKQEEVAVEQEAA